eukprot:7099140-Alexandrium_andersonii.AAC.1
MLDFLADVSSSGDDEPSVVAGVPAVRGAVDLLACLDSDGDAEGGPAAPVGHRPLARGGRAGRRSGGARGF